jgi:antitoxin HicB
LHKAKGSNSLRSACRRTFEALAWLSAHRLAAQDHDGPAHITKAALARKLNTSRSQIDRVLDPNNDDVSVSTLRKAAEAVGQKLELELVAA